MVKSAKKVRRILWAARAQAVGNRRQLNDRAVPRLRALAEKVNEPRLLQAADDAAKAGDHLEAARVALRDVINVLDEISPPLVREGEPG
jgi:hypothetical protein